MADEPLPEHRLRARNTSASSENRIHDDATARAYGFRGALVPGVTVYAYLTRPLVEALGPAWLERGTASVRFLQPVLDGEEVVLAGVVTGRDAQGVQATVTASTAATPTCAVITAALPAAPPTPVNLAVYPAGPLPAERPPASREYFERLAALGSVTIPCDEAAAVDYLDRVDDPLPVYRGPGARVHPGFLLQLGNRAFSLNVQASPWIHVASTVRHLGSARVGDVLTTRGRVRSLFAKKEREFVELDLVLLAGGRPVAHVLHTAIYRLPPPPR